MASVEQVFWPLWAHACYTFDHFTWEKEVRAAAKHGGDRPIVNGVPLLGRLHGLSVENAKMWLRDRCLEFEQNYIRRKEDFLKTRAAASISPDLH